MTSGRIILLNGSSSSGKTTIARMLQQLYREPYQHIALDQFRDGMSDRFRGLNSPSGDPGARGMNVVPIERDGERMTEISLRRCRQASSARDAPGPSPYLPAPATL